MTRIDTITEIIREAGEYMLGADGDTAHTEKSNAKDFVTVADIKTQNIIAARLAAAFPGETVLSEEDEEAKREAMYAEDFTGFVLDPIDGTYNFKRGMKESAISIGHIQNGEADYGAIFDPYKDELFTAEKDGGAFCNGQPIHVSAQQKLAGASVATSNSYDDEGMARNLRRHLALYEQSKTMPWTSCPGSGVLIMAWTACGRIDAYHHNGLKPWDNAAAFLLVREAGGEVARLADQSPARFTDNAVVLGNAAIVQELRQAFANIPAKFLS
jgi:myo-inositol-1(or 4)-monophosphatase